jgi:hypothetical protein
MGAEAEVEPSKNAFSAVKGPDLDLSSRIGHYAVVIIVNLGADPGVSPGFSASLDIRVSRHPDKGRSIVAVDIIGLVLGRCMVHSSLTTLNGVHGCVLCNVGDCGSIR